MSPKQNLRMLDPLSLHHGLKHAGCMWLKRAFCAVRDAFREFSNN